MRVPRRIRAATAADATRIGALARGAYDIYVSRIGRPPAPMVADFITHIAAGEVVVVETGGSIAGYMVSWPEADAYFIDNIAVDPDRQRRGLGRALIDHAAAEARRLGLSAVRLYTNVAMTENRAMYARLGFVETHQTTEGGFHRVYLRWELLDGGRRVDDIRPGKAKS